MRTLDGATGQPPNHPNVSRPLLAPTGGRARAGVSPRSGKMRYAALSVLIVEIAPLNRSWPTLFPDGSMDVGLDR